jgi:hypothetical protein
MKKKENFITGIKKIKDGKATTYADCTSSIMNNVSNISTDSSNPLKKVSNFMTDRSARGSPDPSLKNNLDKF